MRPHLSKHDSPEFPLYFPFSCPSDSASFGVKSPDKPIKSFFNPKKPIVHKNNKLMAVGVKGPKYSEHQFGKLGNDRGCKHTYADHIGIRDTTPKWQHVHLTNLEPRHMLLDLIQLSCKAVSSALYLSLKQRVI